LARRSAVLIVEASKAGGDIHQVMSLTSQYIHDTQSLEREKEALMKPYIVITYVAFLIFLATAIMLQNAFFAPLSKMAVGAGPFGTMQVAISYEESAKFFLHLGMVQAFFCGLVAGKMGEGSVIAGLKHSLLLMVMGYATMSLTLVGLW
jgi:flagellar protein FlaJ